MTQEDPNNSMQTHHPEEAVSGALSIRPSLADPTAAAELFGCAASDFLHAVYGQHAGMESEDESDERIAAIVFGLAALLKIKAALWSCLQAFRRRRRVPDFVSSLAVV